MAKNAAENTAPVTNDATAETVEEAPRPNLTKEQKRKLFTDYQKLQGDVDKAEATLNALLMKRSQSVLDIVGKLGNGPFNVDGEVLTASTRTRKDGVVVAYFRGPGKAQVIEI